MKEGIKNEEGKEIMKCKEDVFAIYLAPHKRDIEKELESYSFTLLGKVR